MEYLLIDGCRDGEMIDLKEAYHWIHLWSDDRPEPTWFTNNEAPQDVMDEYSEKYIKIPMGMWCGEELHVYLSENSPLKISELMNHIIINYKKPTNNYAKYRELTIGQE